MNNTLSKLKEQIINKAYREGEFILASGKKSDYYIDMKEVTLDGQGSLIVGRAIYELIDDWGADAVGGMELGSVPISTAVCLIFAIENKEMKNFVVRKETKGHGTGKKLEGGIAQGSKVVIVEDVVSTGGSSQKAIDAVLESGAEVIGVVTIVDREMGGAASFEGRGLRYKPLLTISQIKGG